MDKAKNSEAKQPEKEFTTRSGIKVKEVYGPSDMTPGWNYEEKLGEPGQFPYTRGLKPASERIKWGIGQYFGFGSGKSTNEFLKYVIEQGAQNLVIAFDLPTQCGYDSDHPMAHGEVGKIGVAIDSLKDVENIFDGINLEGLTISPGGNNAISPIVLAMMLALCEKQGLDPNKVKLVFQNDPLKEFISRGAFIFPPKQAVKFAVDTIEYCHRKNLSAYSTILFCGYHLREGGATISQAMAFTLSNAVAFLDELVSRGIDINDYKASFQTFLSGGIDFFEEIAARRAYRRMYAKIMKERYNCTNKHQGIFLMEYTMGSNLTAQQPLNNVVRCTIAAMAAVIGGCNGLIVSSYDEALGLPSPEALRVAVRTQQIIAEESGIANTVDPLAGSYYVEALTDELEKNATELFNKVLEKGGALSAIESRFYQNEITKSAYKNLKDVESGKRVIVGVNKYVVEEENVVKPMTLTTDEQEQEVVKTLKDMKANRDNAAVQKALAGVKAAAEKGENLVDPILVAVKAYATIGEICGELEKLWGRYEQPGI